MRSRSPSRARSVGPGTRPLYVQAAYLTPGTTSISLSYATSCHSRSVRPPDGRRVLPQSKSRSIALGSKPLTVGSTAVLPSGEPACDEPCPSCGRRGGAAPLSLADTPAPTTAAAAESARRLVKELRNTSQRRSHRPLRGT